MPGRLRVRLWCSPLGRRFGARWPESWRPTRQEVADLVVWRQAEESHRR